MLSLGVDFGSTYSSVSAYRRDTNNVEPMLAGMAAPHIPSVVSVKNGAMDFGKAAKSRTGKSGVRTFKGFKMLLPESSETARQRGYTGEYTPEYITERYLENLLTKAVQYYHRGTRVERLVICVPEIWFQSVRSVNARAKLREICRKYLFVHQMQIVSEPSAACAFFAYNYHRNSRERELYDGQILLIDYGGGTLDITLTEINPCRDKEAPGLMEIRVLEQTGAGENADGEIGEAGIAYMENVMETSLRRYGITPPEGGFRTEPRFMRAVDRLEEDLQSMTEAIRDTYDAFGTENPSDIMDSMDEFTTIEYGGTDIPVRYSVMLEVYRERIYPVLDAKLDEMIQYMNEKKIPFMERNRENFKIALVGGFGNFYLVADQIEKKFAFSSSDRRRQGIIFNRGDRENAISMGAALLAEGIIGIRNTAPYSIGLVSMGCLSDSGTDAGPSFTDYAIHYREPIRFEEPFFAKDADGRPLLYYLSEKGISRIAWSQSRDQSQARVDSIRPEYEDRIRRALADSYGMLASIGFSLDGAGVVSVHIRLHDWFGRPIEGRDKTVELTRLDDLLI